MTVPNRFQQVNFLVNIALAISLAFLIGLLSYKYFFTTSLDSLEAPLLRSGQKFKDLPAINFEKNRYTIMLAGNARCEFFTRSLPLYRSLIEESKKHSDIRVVALFKDKKEDVEIFLKEHELDVEFFPDIDLSASKIGMTPTILWVGRNRTIVGSYESFLEEHNQEALLDLFRKKALGNE